MRRFASAILCYLAAISTGTAFAADPASPAVDRKQPLLTRNADGDVVTIATAKDWAPRRRAILAQMEQVMGPLPDRSAWPPFEAKLVEERSFDGYVRKTYSIRADREDRIPLDLYLPTARGESERLPAMLALHPTGALGKRIVAGDSPLEGRAYAKELAERGYVVLAPDYPSFGDYANYDFGDDGYESGTMKGVANHLRCVDWLQTLPEVDPDRIGVIGHSMGGHNAIFAAAFDERLKVVVSSCGWTPFHDYYGGRLAGWTSDRYMPRIRDVYGSDPDRVPFDFYEACAALAPRPFYSNSPVHDENFDVAGVQKATPRLAAVYTLFDAAPSLVIRHPDCGHDFPEEVREEAYGFVGKALRTKP